MRRSTMQRRQGGVDRFAELLRAGAPQPPVLDWQSCEDLGRGNDWRRSCTPAGKMSGPPSARTSFSWFVLTFLSFAKANGWAQQTSCWGE
jgi:hypothetical protein